jgi:hypothetical protein
MRFSERASGIGHRASGEFALVLGVALSTLFVCSASAQLEPRYAPGKVIVRFDPQGEVSPRAMGEVVAAIGRGEVLYFSSFVPGLSIGTSEQPGATARLMLAYLCAANGSPDGG